MRTRPHQTLVLVLGMLLGSVLFACSSNQASVTTSPLVRLCTLGTHYVRLGANGLNTGENWSDAWTALPDDLQRGHTYYIAPGDYGTYTFNDPEDGDKYICLKKAIDTDHGTDIGWEPAYGAGQAVFSRWEITHSYYKFDGQTGDEAAIWENGHGLKIQYTEGVTSTDPNATNIWLVTFHGDEEWGKALPSHIEFSHMEFEHAGICLDRGDRILWFYSADPGETYNDLVIRYSYLHDCSQMMISSNQARDFLVEYSYFARNSSVGSIHGEAWQDYGSNDVTIRYSRFEDISGTGFIALKKNFNDNHNNWKIYGNLFLHTPGYASTVCSLPGGVTDAVGGVGEGVIVDNGEASTATTSNILIYNNTVYNIDGYNSGFKFWDGDGTCYAYNNMFISNPAKVNNSGINHDYNFYYNNTLIYSATSAHDQLVGVDPFVDLTHYDFRLKEATAPGLSLPAEFNVDVYGHTRGADGNWDRGAIEYVAP